MGQVQFASYTECVHQLTIITNAMNNIEIVRAYYAAMGEKNIQKMAQHLHENIELISPFATIHGKDNVIKALGELCETFISLQFRTTFSSENQVVAIYNFDFPQPIGTARAAALITLQNGLMITIELFFDTRPFGQLVS